MDLRDILLSVASMKIVFNVRAITGCVQIASRDIFLIKIFAFNVGSEDVSSVTIITVVHNAEMTSNCKIIRFVDAKLIQIPVS
jgi:hypothetical protein